MRTRILVWAFLAALVTNGAMIATAVAGPGHGGWGDREDFEDRVEQRAERHLERMAAVLELSDSQQEQIRALHEKARTENAPLREQLAASRERVRALCDAETIDAQAVRNEILAQVDTKTALIISRAQVRSETLKLLTAEQRELAEKLKPQKGSRGHGPRDF